MINGTFWGQDLGWDSCHEISASTGEGVEEVFRVITRRLVEQRNIRNVLEQQAQAALLAASEGRRTPGTAGEYGDRSGYFEDGYGGNAGGSFRVGVGDKRRSWLGLPQFPSVAAEERETREDNPRRRGPCCM